MRMVQMCCPNCDAVLDIKDDMTTQCFCNYCGTRILLDDQQESVIKAKVRLQELEHEKYKIDKEYEDKDKDRKEKAASEKGFLIFACIFFIGFFIFGITGMIAESNKIPVPYSSINFHKMNYEDAVRVLEEAGYTNITVQRTDSTGLFKERKIGLVKSISIDGDQLFRSGKEFRPKANVIIIYYD